MGLLDSIKSIVQDVVQTAQSSASAASTPLTTATTTNTEQSASVMGALAAGQDKSNNISSTTVILSSDYRNVDKNSWTDTYKLNQGDSVDIKKIMNNTYGTEAVKYMSEGERQSAMQSIIDNNRDLMIDCVNETYAMAQVANTVEKQLEEAGIENVDANMVSAIVERIYNPPEFSADDEADEQQLQKQEQEEKNDFIESLKLQLPEGTEFSLDSVLEAGKTVKENPVQFEKNIRVDQIPSEIIEATDFSLPENMENAEIFVPDINTLAHNGTRVDEQLSMTIDFAADKSKLTISAADLEGMSEDEAKQYIENQIAKNYDLYDGTNDVDLTSSYAGIGIMAALGKEEGNNDVFARLDEDPSAFINAMYKQAISESGLELYCPDTEINALYDEKTLSSLMDENGDISEANLRAFFAQEDNAGTITYIHANEDSLMPYVDEEGNSILTGSDVLNAYKFNGKTLADLAQNGDSGDKELALSAFEQIASNNPNMEQNAYNQYIASLNLEEGQTKPSLESLTAEQKLEMYLNADYSKTANANGGEIILENIQYILNKGTPTPVVLADEVPETPATPEETPTVPEETPTEPEPTPTEPDPIPTDPEPTDPIPTDPEPTDPIPTDPKPTTPTNPCPEEPEVSKPDENLDIERPPKLDEPETSETPTQVPETPSETPSTCPDVPEVTRPEETPTEAPIPTQAPSETPTEAPTVCPTEPPQGNTNYDNNDVTDDETGFASQSSPQTSSNEAAVAQAVQETVQAVQESTPAPAAAAPAPASQPAVQQAVQEAVQEAIEELES